VTALALVICRSGAAQQPVYRAGIRTVPVYVTVSDNGGRLVPNLVKDDFRVFDDGRPVNIDVFSNQAQAITVVIMLDTSGSMGVRITRVRQSTDRFIDAIAPGDRARLGSFGWEVSLSPMLTGDKTRLRRVLQEELWPGGPTPLWRALLAGMTSLEGEGGRRVVLVLTDGDDNDLYENPRPNAAEVRRRAVRDAFMVYAIGMNRSQRTVQFSYTDERGADVRGERPSGLALGGLTDEMVKLVEETGGGHFEVQADADLGATFARVGEELRHQYLLGFSPEALDGKTHALDVQVRAAGCRARARRYYVAGEER